MTYFRGDIYLAQRPDEVIKIGVSENAALRIKRQLDPETGHRARLILVDSIPKAGFTIEQALHDVLGDYRHGTAREWYRPERAVFDLFWKVKGMYAREGHPETFRYLLELAREEKVA